MDNEEDTEQCAIPLEGYAGAPVYYLFDKLSETDEEERGGVTQDALKHFMISEGYLDGIPDGMVDDFLAVEMELADQDCDGLLGLQEFLIYLYSELYCLVPVWGPPGDVTSVTCADHDIRPSDPPGLIRGRYVGDPLYNIFMVHSMHANKLSKKTKPLWYGWDGPNPSPWRQNTTPTAGIHFAGMQMHQLTWLIAQSQVLDSKSSNRVVHSAMSRARGDRIRRQVNSSCSLQYMQFLHTLMFIAESKESGFDEVAYRVVANGEAPPRGDGSSIRGRAVYWGCDHWVKRLRPVFYKYNMARKKGPLRISKMTRDTFLKIARDTPSIRANLENGPSRMAMKAPSPYWTPPSAISSSVHLTPHKLDICFERSSSVNGVYGVATKGRDKSSREQTVNFIQFLEALRLVAMEIVDHPHLHWSHTETCLAVIIEEIVVIGGPQRKVAGS